MLIKDCIILAILVVLGPQGDEMSKVPTRIIDQKKAVKYEISQITNFLMWLLKNFYELLFRVNVLRLLN